MKFPLHPLAIERLSEEHRQFFVPSIQEAEAARQFSNTSPETMEAMRQWGVIPLSPVDDVIYDVTHLRIDPGIVEPAAR